MQETSTRQGNKMANQQIGVLPSVFDPKATGISPTDTVLLLPNQENITKSEGDQESATITDRSDPDREKNMTRVCKNERSREITNTDREVGEVARMKKDKEANLSVYYCFPDRPMTKLNAEEVKGLVNPEVSVPVVTASPSKATDSDPVTTEASSSAVSTSVTHGASKTTLKDPVTLESSKTTHIYYYPDGSMKKLSAEAVQKTITKESSTTTILDPVTPEFSTIVSEPGTLESSTAFSDPVILRPSRTTVPDSFTLESSTTTVPDLVTPEASTTTVSDPVTLGTSISRVSDPVTLKISTATVSDPITLGTSTSRVSDHITLKFSTAKISDSVKQETSTSRVETPVEHLSVTGSADPVTLKSSTAKNSDQASQESPFTIDVNKIVQCGLQNVDASRLCVTEQLQDIEKEQMSTEMSTPNSGNIGAPNATSASVVPNQASISWTTAATLVQDKTAQSVSKHQVTPSVIPIKLHANINLHFAPPTSICEVGKSPQTITHSEVETTSSQHTVSVVSVNGRDPNKKHENTIQQTVTPPTSSVCSTVFVHKDLETAVSKISQASMESLAGQLASPCTESSLKLAPDCFPNVISVPVLPTTQSCPQGDNVCPLSANLPNAEELCKNSCSTFKVQSSIQTSVSAQKQPEEVKTPTSDQNVVYVKSPARTPASQKYYVMCTQDKKLLVPITRFANLKDGLKSRAEAVSLDKAKVLTLSLVKSAQSKSGPQQLDGNSDLEVTKEGNQSNKFPKQIPSTDPKGVKHEVKMKRKIKRGMSRKLKQCKCCYVVLHPYYVRSKDTTVRTRRAKFMNCSEQCRSAFLSSYFKKHKDLKTPRQIWRNMYDKKLALEQAESVDESDAKEKDSDSTSQAQNILEVISNSGYYGQTKVEKYKLTSSSLKEGDTILKDDNFSAGKSPKTLKLCIIKPKDTIRNTYDGMRSSATITPSKEILGSTKFQRSPPKSQTVNIQYISHGDVSQKRTDDATKKNQETSKRKPEYILPKPVLEPVAIDVTNTNIMSNKAACTTVGGLPATPLSRSEMTNRTSKPGLVQLTTGGSLASSGSRVQPIFVSVNAEVPSAFTETKIGCTSGLTPATSGARPVFAPESAVSNSGLSCTGGGPPLGPIYAIENPALFSLNRNVPDYQVRKYGNSGLYRSAKKVSPPALGNSGLYTSLERPTLGPVTAVGNSELSVSEVRPPIAPVTAVGHSGLSVSEVRPPIVLGTTVGNSSLSVSGVRPQIVPGTAVGMSGLSTSRVRTLAVPVTAVGNSRLSSSGVRPTIVPVTAIGNSGVSKLGVRPSSVPVTAVGNTSLSMSRVRPQLIPGMAVENSGLPTSGSGPPVVPGRAVGMSGLSTLRVRTLVVPVTAAGNLGLSTSGVTPPIAPVTAMGNSGLSTLGTRPPLVPVMSVGNSGLSMSGVRPTLVPVLNAVGNSRPSVVPVTTPCYSGLSSVRPIYIPVTSFNNLTAPAQTGTIPATGFVRNLPNATHPVVPVTLVANLASSQHQPKPVLAASTKAGNSTLLTTSKSVQVGHVTAVTNCATLLLSSLSSQLGMGAAPAAKLVNTVSTPGTKRVVTPVTTPGSRYVNVSALSGTTPVSGPVNTASQLGVPLKSFPGSYVVNNVFGVSPDNTQTGQIGMPFITFPASSNNVKNSDVSIKTHASGQLSSVSASSNIMQIPKTQTTVQGAPIRSVLATRLPLNSNVLGVLNQALSGSVNRLANNRPSMVVPNSTTSKGVLLIATVPTCRNMPIRIVPLSSYGSTLQSFVTRSGSTVLSTTPYQSTSNCAPAIPSTATSCTPSTATSSSFGGFQVKSEPITEGYGDEKDATFPVVSVKAEPMDRGYPDEPPRMMNTYPQSRGKRKSLDDYNSDTEGVSSKRFKRSNKSIADHKEEENIFSSVVVKTEPGANESETDQYGQDKNKSSVSAKPADKPGKPESKDESDVAWHMEKVRSLQQKLKETLQELEELKKKKS